MSYLELLWSELLRLYIIKFYAKTQPNSRVKDLFVFFNYIYSFDLNFYIKWDIFWNFFYFACIRY